MKGVNKVILVGTLGQDPETRYTQSGTAITNISMATTEKWKDKQTGQQQEKTEWHRVAFFGKLAEIAGEYLRKGSKAYVEGSLETKKWQDQQGQDRFTTQVKASEMQMLDSRQDNQQSGNGNAYSTNQAGQQFAQAPANRGAVPHQQNAPARNAAGLHSDQSWADEDIPY